MLGLNNNHRNLKPLKEKIKKHHKNRQTMCHPKVITTIKYH